MRFWMNQGTTMCFNDIEKDIEYCSKYGFEAIELKYSLICNSDQSWIKELLYRNKIRVGSIGAVQIPILQKEEVKRKGEMQLRNFCQCAYLLQSEYIIMIPPREKIKVEENVIIEDTVKILEEYSNIAEEYNVKLALEVMGFSDSYIHTIQEGLRIIHMTEKDNIGLIYDFYHVLGMEDLGKAILKAEPKDIFIVHINDGHKCVAGDYADDNRLWPYDGGIDIEMQLSMLQKIGYRGPFSMEVYHSQGWPFDIQECYKIARNKVREIKSKCQYIL